MAENEEQEREAAARKSRSEEILRGAGVGINEWLPTIETKDEITFREPIDIARRAVCLLLVAGRASGLEAEIVSGLIEDYGVDEFFTPLERAFLASDSPQREDLVQFSWRSEACWVLLWALGLVSELDLPYEQISPGDAIGIVADTPIEALVERSSLRWKDEILDAADLIYRCHWYVRQLGLDGREEEIVFSPGVTMERHQALNWLIGYDESEWDDVSTDT